MADVKIQSDTKYFCFAESPRSVLFQLTGAGSVCWEHVDRAGVFNEARAREITEDAIARLAELGVTISDG